MKIRCVDEFKQALKLIQLEQLNILCVQVEADFSTLGVPRQVVETDEEYERFGKVVREGFPAKDIVLVQLNSGMLEIIYKSVHYPRIFPQVFKAFEDFVWRRKDAASKFRKG